jgi:rSAM/selenodomain-associated transferase 2
MHYNDGLAEIFRFILGTAALPLLLLLVFGLLILIYLFEQDELRSVYLALGVVLVCLPTLHPWYLLLMAPLMVLYPSRAWLYFMLATIVMLPVLATEVETGVFQEIKWLKWVEYLPFFGLLIYDTLVRRSFFSNQPFPKPGSVSVIMPVLNEAERIQAAIEAARSETGVAEVIVVDGGSQDTTQKRAQGAGARVVSGPRGRGFQVCAGIPLATGDVILVLHADTVLVAGAAERMLTALTKSPMIAGGAFGMSFADDSPGMFLIGWLNNFRARWFGIAFGDQGQFFRRAALQRMGGFPAMMLMEDVELSLRLKRFGRPLFVRSGVRVSVRRWERRGFLGNLGMVLKLFVHYLVERRMNGADGIRTDYYRRYYGKVQ